MQPSTLLHVFPTFAIGGQQTRFATVASRLGDRYRHIVVSLDGRDTALALLAKDVQVRMEPARRLSGLAAWRTYGAALRSIRPDALVTYNWGPIEWAIANRLGEQRPHIHLEDGFGVDEADRQLARRVLTRSIVLRRSEVVVPSRNLERIALRRWHLPPRRVSYIPNGIDARRFDRTAAASGYFERDGECVIGTFAPLRPEKNIARLIRSFARLEGRLRLVICGDGPQAGPLRALADELGLADRVTFTGHVPAPELVMEQFDIFAISSDTEQMPYAVLEAMCARLPVVGTDVGDVGAMLHPDNRRFVVPRDEPDALAAALRVLAADADLRRALGERNRADVERRFTIEQMTTGFATILDRALGASSR